MATSTLKAGPMLRYDTVKDDIWHGFALIVVDDQQHQQPPALTYHQSSSGGQAVAAPAPTENGEAADGASGTDAKPTKLYSYNDEGTVYSFYRYKIEVPVQDGETTVKYEIAGITNTFYVAAKAQNFRWAGHSCNGFSEGIPQDEWNGANPLWDDVLRHHENSHFHAVIGGGDQIYCDSLMVEPGMQVWVKSDAKKRQAMDLSPDLSKCIEQYFFHHYLEGFGQGSFAKTIAQIPMINMLDDHDLTDGFGTYPDDLMNSPVFNNIGKRGYFWYLLFQQFIVPDVDGNSEESHPYKSIIIGQDGAYIPFKNISFLTYLGPKQYILLIDCRSERKIDQICSKPTYEHIFQNVRGMPAGVEHLVVLLGVPLAYPRMVFLERALSSSFNPLLLLAKGLSPSFTNDFNGQAELLDDIGDHWCAAPHKHERNWLIENLQELVLEKHFRMSYISGDVHATGCGVFFGYHQHDPAKDPKYSLAVITSAIVNPPPPPAVITMLNKLAAKKHRSLFKIGTKETMVPLFTEDLNGKKQNDKYILGARNWTAVTYDDGTCELEFDIRCEKSKGSGETKSYAVRAPPPKWNIDKEHHHLLHHRDFEKLVAEKMHLSKREKAETVGVVKDPAAVAVVAK